MILNRWKGRGERKALRAAHLIALEPAREVYERHRHESSVISTGEGPGYSFISAASPSRVAWDAYFDGMQKQGHSAWDTEKLFDRALKGWEEDSP